VNNTTNTNSTRINSWLRVGKQNMCFIPGLIKICFVYHTSGFWRSVRIDLKT